MTGGSTSVFVPGDILLHSPDKADECPSAFDPGENPPLVTNDRPGLKAATDDPLGEGITGKGRACILE